jgi:hypothetical protein
MDSFDFTHGNINKPQDDLDILKQILTCASVMIFLASIFIFVEKCC